MINIKIKNKYIPNPRKKSSFSNSKGMFLQKLDNFRKYDFVIHGVYETEGDYKVEEMKS